MIDFVVTNVKLISLFESILLSDKPRLALSHSGKICNICTGNNVPVTICDTLMEAVHWAGTSRWVA